MTGTDNTNLVSRLRGWSWKRKQKLLLARSVQMLGSVVWNNKKSECLSKTLPARRIFSEECNESRILLEELSIRPNTASKVGIIITDNKLYATKLSRASLYQHALFTFITNKSMCFFYHSLSGTCSSQSIYSHKVRFLFPVLLKRLPALTYLQCIFKICVKNSFNLR